MDRYKNKDLLGPLKYIDTGLSEAIPASKLESTQESKLQPKLDQKPKTSQQPEASLGGLTAVNEQLIDVDDFSYEHFIFNLPLVVHRKPYLRHIKFYVKPNSTLHVVAPLNRPLEVIKKEIGEHQDWIEKCDQGFQKLRLKFPVKQFETGEAYPLLGEPFYLKLDAIDLKKPVIQIDLDQLQYFYPESWDLKPKKETAFLLKKHLMNFYHEKAINHLNQRLRILSKLTGLYPKRVSYRNQKTRWGSCTSVGNINLNWKLVAFEPDLIDYVIIHELCHLIHPNHSRRFWSLVSSHCPNFKLLDKQLAQVQYEVDFLAPESELYFSNPKLL